MALYTPRHFAITNDAVISEFIAEESFGSLISYGDGEPVFSYIPLEFNPENRTIRGHLARANPHVQLLALGTPTMIGIHGPHAYISSSWYSQDTPQVPTWNYMVAHLYGRAELIEPEELIRDLNDLVDHYEPDRESLNMPDSHIARISPGIVGFRFVIDRWEAKFKLSQNRTPEDAKRIIEHLNKSEKPTDKTVANWMLRMPKS